MPRKCDLFSWYKKDGCLVIRNGDGSQAASIPLQKPFMWRFLAKDWETDPSLSRPMFRITVFNGLMKVFVYEDELAFALYYWATEFADKHSAGTLQLMKNGCKLVKSGGNSELWIKIDEKPENMLAVIRHFRSIISNCGLKEAKDLMDFARAAWTKVPENYYSNIDTFMQKLLQTPCLLQAEIKEKS